MATWTFPKGQAAGPICALLNALSIDRCRVKNKIKFKSMNPDLNSANLRRVVHPYSFGFHSFTYGLRASSCGYVYPAWLLQPSCGKRLYEFNRTQAHENHELAGDCSLQSLPCEVQR